MSSSLHKSKKSKKSKESRRRPQTSASSGGSGSEAAFEQPRDQTPHGSNTVNRNPESPAEGVSGSLFSLPSATQVGDGKAR